LITVQIDRKTAAEIDGVCSLIVLAAIDVL
jgi:hypothetical protein